MSSPKHDPCQTDNVRVSKEELCSWKAAIIFSTLVILLNIGITVISVLFLVPLAIKSCDTQSPSADIQPVSPRIAHPVIATNLGVIIPRIDSGKYFETCDEYLKNGFTRSGVYRLKRVNNSDPYDFNAQCKMNASGDGRAWMLMQKRTGTSEVFWSRSYSDYVQGFGNVYGDMWLGLRNVRHLIGAGHKLLLKMEIEGDRCEKDQYYYYFGIWKFEIGPEENKFRLNMSQIISGNFTSLVIDFQSSNGLQFQAMQQANKVGNPCLSQLRTGGWWSTDKECPLFSLNAEYSCTFLNAIYGLNVRRLDDRNFAKILKYLYPSATQMSLHVCDEDQMECL